MPGSRGNDRQNAPAGANRDRLAEWETRAFTVLRRQADASTPVDDELPDDPWLDLDELRSSLARLPGA